MLIQLSKRSIVLLPHSSCIIVGGKVHNYWRWAFYIFYTYTKTFGNFCKHFIINFLSLYFIKKFNWIIDYQNKKVFYQENKKSKLKIETSKPFQSSTISNEQLIVSMVNKEQSTYTLGRIIDSIQGIKVTLQNICHYRKLLNANQNWDSLKVVVK